MNFNKNSFTPEEFDALPVHDLVKGVPPNTPFLLGGKMASQKDIVKDLKKKNPNAEKMKVVFWKRTKDLHIREEGAFVIFPKKINTEENVNA